jgi:hypothetical protein
MSAGPQNLATGLQSETRIMGKDIGAKQLPEKFTASSQD